ELNISKSLANMLVQRNITTFDEARDYFRPSLDKLHDPFLMKDMDVAIDRLDKAIDSKEKILIYGDYDVDGTTSVALVYSFLRKIHQNIDYYIPDRYGEGYGISYKGVEYAAENEVSLVIALDCGIKANDKIALANEKGIDFIICDHHNPGEEIPKALAVLDPKRIDCHYPYKDLSGCGVGFKLLQALTIHRKLSFKDLYEYLDLVAVSIASDIVSITGENRILAFYGLKQLNNSPRMGLKSIIQTSSLEVKEISISDVVFKIGPRINAAGRIESGKSAVKLLIEEDKDFAAELCEKINVHNETRQHLDRTITEEALEMINSDERLQQKSSTVLFNDNWHKGVIGIVASRIIENYYKPTVILTQSNGLATGSARSVDGFDLYAAIDYCSDLLENFGGHKHAAGLTMKPENIKKFEEKFEEFVSQNITEQQLMPQINIDQKISFSDITPKFYRIMKQFAPFGPGNMSPIYMTEQVQDGGYSRIVGKTAEHIKLDLVDMDNNRKEGIGFFMADLFEIVSNSYMFNICYSIEENEFNGNISLQLRIRDIQKCE
ncbi:MAG: single-stranded-DNA-specific exonuclease RecJ, partial [Bacteroidales bacterium]|nr:single-stranded-DNA-specific exonuclease RecJ [Bacteroidales bacterium]